MDAIYDWQKHVSSLFVILRKSNSYRHMGFIGKIIKRAIDLGGFISSDPDPERAQLQQLCHLLEKARHTVFGKAYRFADILASNNPIEAFQQTVPIHDYDQLYEVW